jgi:hypothetical protein
LKEQVPYHTRHVNGVLLALMLFAMMIFQGKGSGSSRHHTDHIFSSTRYQIHGQTSYMMHVISINGETQSLLDESKQDIEGTTAEESAQIGKQINSNLMSLSKEKTQETDDK